MGQWGSRQAPTLLGSVETLAQEERSFCPRNAQHLGKQLLQLCTGLPRTSIRNLFFFLNLLRRQCYFISYNNKCGKVVYILCSPVNSSVKIDMCLNKKKSAHRCLFSFYNLHHFIVCVTLHINISNGQTVWAEHQFSPKQRRAAQCILWPWLLVRCKPLPIRGTEHSE